MWNVHRAWATVVALALAGCEHLTAPTRSEDRVVVSLDPSSTVLATLDRADGVTAVFHGTKDARGQTVSIEEVQISGWRTRTVIAGYDPAGRPTKAVIDGDSARVLWRDGQHGTLEITLAGGEVIRYPIVFPSGVHEGIHASSLGFSSEYSITYVEHGGDEHECYRLQEKLGTLCHAPAHVRSWCRSIPPILPRLADVIAFCESLASVSEFICGLKDVVDAQLAEDKCRIIPAANAPTLERPTLRIDGGVSASRKQLEEFVFTGHEYTPRRNVSRWFRYPDGTNVALEPMDATSSGEIRWRFAPQCSSPTGRYLVWAEDDSTGAQSNTVEEHIVRNEQCGTNPPSPTLAPTAAPTPTPRPSTPTQPTAEPVTPTPTPTATPQTPMPATPTPTPTSTPTPEPTTPPACKPPFPNGVSTSAQGTVSGDLTITCDIPPSDCPDLTAMFTATQQGGSGFFSATDSTRPFSVVWDTRQQPNGTYAILCGASTSSGGSNSSPNSVTVAIQN